MHNGIIYTKDNKDVKIIKN